MAQTVIVDGKSYLWQGKDTLKVPVSLFELNRKRLSKALQATGVSANSFVCLKGGKPLNLYNTDVEYLFRQEPFFMWAFGIGQPSLTGLISVESGESYLFIPRLPEEYLVWAGKILSVDDYKLAFNIDHVYYEDEMQDVLNTLNKPTLLTLKGINSDSKLPFEEVKLPGILNVEFNDEVLYDVISECRVIKTELELKVLRYVSKISSDAHKEVMLRIKPGKMEYEMESIFLNYCYSMGGCRHVSYTCICGTGLNSTVLHYGHEGAPNDKEIKAGDMCLFDMGANYFGYASDITCSFPATGTFTDDQKLIYKAVLAAIGAVIGALKEGVSWVAMHVLANKVLLQHLIDIGILKGDVDSMLQDELAAVFQPHGLGHFVGLDVHDVGGYLKGHPERPNNKSLKNLRTARVLQAGMVLTVEPGCYFISSVLDSALDDDRLKQYLDPKVLYKFRDFGGVRIEDVVVILKDGCEVISKVPRRVGEIEIFMKQL